ncbi:unnamed protein product [Soboliphyme baturini]|uniref:ARMET_N domain-containing protein n=1 Tax=Soboliphyme baturini TaxID=241478 RepID=A0A183IF09_9BILA|nr:unnamed protein product [Soboliphyme baturini]
MTGDFTHLLCMFLLGACITEATADQSCEVCVGFLKKTATELSEQGISDSAKIEQFIKSKCEKATGKESRFVC